MTREAAFAVVRQRGGTPRRGVTRDTGVLIVGELGWPLLDDGRPSNSLCQAKCYGVPIARERQFLEWVGRAAPEEQEKTYTAEQVSSLARASLSLVEQLGALGLLQPCGNLYGFRDLAAARQIAGLLAKGITLSTITRSLAEIRKWLPDAQLSNVRLVPQSSDRVLVEQLQGHTDRNGQFQLPMQRLDEDAVVLLDEARSAAEAGDAATAERVYRRIMKLDRTDAIAPFRLAILLCAEGKSIEAEAAYRQAVERDRDFAEAWYNLGGLLDDQGRAVEATTCLQKALEADPTYADAMFNLALLYQKHERYKDAVAWWKRYVDVDSTSSWAARAKRALKYCEILLASDS
jgi:tetratricopeptide (TPR) repeat protein